MLSSSLCRGFIAGCLWLPISFQALAEPLQQSEDSLTILPDSALIYVSDYFSFVGQDGQSHVAFALDNNRGRDGDAYQAEHFLVMHDENHGWVTLAGNGAYENRGKELENIPDSPYFQFDGTPRAGMTITSESNHLRLRIDPIPTRTRNQHNGAVTWMGSAQALLTWNGRKIPGRVIYEYVMMPEFNRLTRRYPGMWKDFQGLYAMAGISGDIYVHSQQSEQIASLVGRLAGFAAFSEQTLPMNDLTIEVLDRNLALGFYRWPTAWRITWTNSRGPATLVLSLSDRKGIANWFIGGFSMGIVKGELDYAAQKQQIYGLAELIM